ncbi:MAG: hypothetical protein KC912_21960 [Proteobacteria bacterium]|nr:hypothetical protein [Pseudomonadota bacterium]
MQRTSRWLPLLGVGLLVACGGADADGDGLTNSEESELGTNAQVADTDGDGLSDGEEVGLGTNPVMQDSDGDGWADGDEITGNTDPLLTEDHPYTGGWQIGACRDDIVSTGNALGNIAEDFELMDQHGDMLSLHDFCDREVLLVGSAFW